MDGTRASREAIHEATMYGRFDLHYQPELTPHYYSQIASRRASELANKYELHPNEAARLHILIIDSFEAEQDMAIWELGQREDLMRCLDPETHFSKLVNKPWWQPE